MIAECSGDCARLAVFETFLAFGLYLGTIFGLPRYFVGGDEGFSRDSWRQAFPARRWLPVWHELLSIPVFLLSPLAAMLVGSVWDARPPHQFGVATLLWITVLNSWNGLFEVITGVSPLYGVILRRSHSQHFIVHPAVRRLGLARLVLSVFFVLLSWGVSQWR